MAQKQKRSRGGVSLGPSTDASNTPVVDPTENVKALVIAEGRRQDDLRVASEQHQFEKEQLRASWEVERQSLLRESREKETQRIDAVRTVDVQVAQQRANDAETRAATLAKQVTDSAEALRNQVDQAQVTATAYVDARLVPITETIQGLQRAQYELAGAKVGVADKTDSSAELAAALRPLIESVAALSDDRNNRQGRKAMFDQGQVVFLGLLAIGVGLLGHFIK